MTLRARLSVGLIGIAVILIAPLVLALRSLTALHETTRKLGDEAVAGSAELRRIQGFVEDARLAEDALIFVHDTASLSRVHRAADSVGAAADSLGRYSLEAHTADLRTFAEQLRRGADAVFGHASAGRVGEAERAADAQVGPALRGLELTVLRAERAVQERTQRTVRAASESAQEARGAAALALLLALGAGGTIAVLLTRSISRPVNELDRGMRQVAEGDFGDTVAISPARSDEFGRLASSFHEMTRQLRELDRMKSEFVSIATHELKTPINVILGYVQLLEDGLYGTLNARQLDACHTVTRQARSLDRLVRRLLDISRFEAGVVELEVAPLDLQELLESVRSDFSILAEQRDIRLTVDMAPDVPRTAYWDAVRMGEVLGNLVSNALNFTERGGRVGVAVTLQGEHQVRLEVSDTGVGINPEQLPHVFEKFFQARNQSAAYTKGSGLGLAIVKEIVEAHGGTITADSRLGEGTRFTMLLPVDARPAAPPAPESTVSAERAYVS
jgi:signal transduction histidine kinase